MLSDDLMLQVSRARETLRTAAQRGRRTADADQALSRMLALSQHAGEDALFFECQRWAVQLTTLRSM